MKVVTIKCPLMCLIGLIAWLFKGKEWKDGETGLGYKLVKEAAREREMKRREKERARDPDLEIDEDKPLIEILESVVDPDKMGFDPSYDIDIVSSVVRSIIIHII